MEQGFVVSLKDIYVEFDNEVILNKINLNIRDKEFVTLLGPSGCGKTTTLRIIGGFLNPNSGDVYFEDQKINNVPPHKRNVNTVFQKYALFPHLNVFENVAFGLRLKKMPELDIKNKVKEMLSIVDLKGYEKRPISKLSGGQQQRVAIARALVCDPKILLLDEPLGALDLKLRKDMQIELKRIQQKLQTTFIYVTHDQEEALTMSDTVVVMNNGSIEQIGTPTDIYNEPANAFVADFIGEANIINGTMIKDFSVEICGAQFECLDKNFGENRPVDVVVRPEDVDVIPLEKAKLSGVVENAVFKGVHYEMTVNVGGYYWLIHSTTCQRVGSVIGIDFIPDNIHIMKKLFPTQNNIFDTVVVSSSEEDNQMELQLENTTVTVEGHYYPEGTKLHISLPPEAVSIAADGNGDLTAYIVSVIYKGSHNEIILETDERKWIMNCEQDEQVATYVSLRFDFENAAFTMSDGNAEVGENGL